MAGLTPHSFVRTINSWRWRLRSKSPGTTAFLSIRLAISQRKCSRPLQGNRKTLRSQKIFASRSFSPFHFQTGSLAGPGIQRKLSRIQLQMVSAMRQDLKPGRTTLVICQMCLPRPRGTRPGPKWRQCPPSESQDAFHIDIEEILEDLLVKRNSCTKKEPLTDEEDLVLETAWKLAQGIVYGDTPRPTLKEIAEQKVEYFDAPRICAAQDVRNDGSDRPLSVYHTAASISIVSVMSGDDEWSD